MRAGGHVWRVVSFCWDSGVPRRSWHRKGFGKCWECRRCGAQILSYTPPRPSRGRISAQWRCARFENGVRVTPWRLQTTYTMTPSSCNENIVARVLRS